MVLVWKRRGEGEVEVKDFISGLAKARRVNCGPALFAGPTTSSTLRQLEVPLYHQTRNRCRSTTLLFAVSPSYSLSAPLLTIALQRIYELSLATRRFLVPRPPILPTHRTHIRIGSPHRLSRLALPPRSQTRQPILVRPAPLPAPPRGLNGQQGNQRQPIQPLGSPIKVSLPQPTSCDNRFTTSRSPSIVTTRLHPVNDTLVPRRSYLYHIPRSC